MTGSGSLTSAAQDITGINVSSLPDGTLTFSVTLTDGRQHGRGGHGRDDALHRPCRDIDVTGHLGHGRAGLYLHPADQRARRRRGYRHAGHLARRHDVRRVDADLHLDAHGRPGGHFAVVHGDAHRYRRQQRHAGPGVCRGGGGQRADGDRPAGDRGDRFAGSGRLQHTNAGTPNFTVTTSSTSDPNGNDLTATLMPQTNQVLKIVTNLGEMDFQLLDNYTPDTVAHFVSLVNSGTYTNTSFYRVIQNFMIQGGTGGTGSTIPVELNPDLRFTSSGLLAMANNGVDGNSSEFFITNPDDMSDGFLDFRYTIFGKLISGDNVRQAIAATPVTTNSSGEDSQPVTPVTIESMSVTTETDAGVFMLQAASGATGAYTVTVSDGLGGSQTFTVNVGTNPYDPPNPWVQPISRRQQQRRQLGRPDLHHRQYAGDLYPAGGIRRRLGREVDVQTFLAVPSGHRGLRRQLLYRHQPARGHDQSGHDAHAERFQLHRDAGQRVLRRAVPGGQGLTPVSGTFQLQVGSTTTAAIDFDSTDLPATAANMQTALRNAGFSGATVSGRPVFDPADLQLRRDVRRQRVARHLPGGNHRCAGHLREFRLRGGRDPGTDLYGSRGLRGTRVPVSARSIAPSCRSTVDPPAPQIDSISRGRTDRYRAARSPTTPARPPN